MLWAAQALMVSFASALICGRRQPIYNARDYGSLLCLGHVFAKARDFVFYRVEWVVNFGKDGTESPISLLSVKAVALQVLQYAVLRLAQFA